MRIPKQKKKTGVIKILNRQYSKAICYHCRTQVQNLTKDFAENFVSASKNNRNAVVFCGVNCFRAYLDKNRPNMKIFEKDRAASAYLRIVKRREQIEEKLQFISPNTSEYHLFEEIFLELNTIIEGRREVTSHLERPIQVLER